MHAAKVLDAPPDAPQHEEQPQNLFDMIAEYEASLSDDELKAWEQEIERKKETL